MHTAVIQSPQAMSNDQSYRPRSPSLPGFTESQPQNQHPQPPLRLTRLPSYQIQEPSLPKGYSFSPRGSYDASPFFSQLSQSASNSQHGTEQSNFFAATSPTRFPPTSLADLPQVFSPISYTEPTRRQYISPSHYASPVHLPNQQQQATQQYQQEADDMARLRSRKPVNYNEDHNGTQYEEPIPNYSPPQQFHQMPQMPQVSQQPQMPQIPQQPQHMMQHQAPPPQPQFVQHPMVLQQQFQVPIQQQQQAPPRPTTTPLPNIDVKTKFPVARIKRIMQADEDVGKVAQATPTAVSKALELFMIALVTKGALEAKNNNTKRVTATHLKHALLTDPQFDFLNEICESVPDEGAKGSKGRAKSEAKSEDSDEEMANVPKKKAKASKKKKGGDDGSSD